MKKRILSILLTLCMVLMLCPVTAFADEHVYRVAGEPALCDSGWAATDDDNRMTYNGETGRYEKVYTGVRSESYMYKITVDGAWSDDFAEIKTVEVENDNATVTVWYVETTGEWGADVAYGTPAEPALAITVNGFEVGKTPADCTYSFESTIPGVTFGKDDVALITWNKYVEEIGGWESIYDDEWFEAGTRYQLVLFLNDKGLSELPAVTINGKTPEFCEFDGDSRIVIECEFGTPAAPPAPSLVRGDIDLDGEVTVKDATMLQDCLENPESLEKLTSEQYEAADFNGDGAVTESDLTALRSFLNPITIDGPDVVCAQQDYEFTVTPAAGVTLDKQFGFDTGGKGSGVDLTIDENGVGHGVMLTEWYDLNTNYFDLIVYGYTADQPFVSATKRVQVSQDHVYVDGVCGCGAVLQYIVEYIGSADDPICMEVKTHGKDLTLRGETFTKDGYVQTGWVDKETGAVYALGDTYTEDADVTLNPVFEKLITLTVPYTTTVALGDVGVPGEKTFTLTRIGDSAPDKDKSNVTVSGSVTTNGKGSYNGTLTITGPEETLWYMLSEGAFVQQVDNGEAGWTVDDTVWGVLMEEIPVAYATSDDAVASEYTAYAVPASIDGQGNYYIDWENVQKADMTFTNTYTAHVYELNHDADGHWDECTGCGDIQNEEAHKYGDWTVTKEATETAKGEKEHTCTICGYTETAEITKLPATTDPTKPDTETKSDTTSPQTGDNSNMALWIALLFMSGAGVIGTTVYGKKKRAK